MKMNLTRKAMVVLTLLGVQATAFAMTYFLTSQWVEGGKRHCKYGNGTVLNVGASTCPMSIEG